MAILRKEFDDLNGCPEMERRFLRWQLDMAFRGEVREKEENTQDQPSKAKNKTTIEPDAT